MKNSFSPKNYDIFTNASLVEDNSTILSYREKKKTIIIRDLNVRGSFLSK